MQHGAKQSPGFPMFSCAGAEELEDCIAIESTAFVGAHEDEDEPSRSCLLESVGTWGRSDDEVAARVTTQTSSSRA